MAFSEVLLLLGSPPQRRALIGRIYAEYGFVFDPAIEVPDLLTFDDHYRPPHGAFFVVRHDGRLAGSVGVERLDAESAELHRLYLDADLRGRGTGRALVDAVLDWCRATTRASTASSGGCDGAAQLLVGYQPPRRLP